MELQHFIHGHKLLLNEKNNLDPDEGISCLCFVCRLPIFYTPYYRCSSAGCNDFFIHQRCAHLPKQLKHLSGRDLQASVDSDNFMSELCHKCHRNCSYVAWRSKDIKWMIVSREEDTRRTSGFRREIFDAMCVAPLELRIFHGSHEHELIPMNIEEFTICGACGLRHENEGKRRSSTFYWCCWCNFRLHEKCATLPNYIQHREHADHPLALTYALPRGDEISYHCGICQDAITSVGIYFCGKCSYYAHIKCATHRSELYELGDLSTYWTQFPMEDEDTSLVAHILDNMKLENNNHPSSSDKHDHPLILNATSSNPGRTLICNGCVQPISSPYYSCSQCPDYLLHESCANLPRSIVRPEEPHPLFLITNDDVYGFRCVGCRYRCNGFSYRCNDCDYVLDVQCALLPNSITHKAHDKRHVLHFMCEFYPNAKCCGGQRFSNSHYICTGFGCDFRIHGFCAGLPMYARHKFDKHRLKLNMGHAPVTSDHQDEIDYCEFCEKEITSEFWYYDCAECNHSFHVECISSVGENSKMKLRTDLKAPYHPHPLSSIRLLTKVGRNGRCGLCHEEIQNFKDEIAFECFECDLTFHEFCVSVEFFHRYKRC